MHFSAWSLLSSVACSTDGICACPERSCFSYSASIRSWLTRKNFLEEWSRTKKEFDAAFVKYLDEMIAQKAGIE